MLTMTVCTFTLFHLDNAAQVSSDVDVQQIPLLSFVITGAISVAASLLLVAAFTVLYRMAKQRRRKANRFQWPTSPSLCTPLRSVDNSECTTPDQSAFCLTHESPSTDTSDKF